MRITHWFTIFQGSHSHSVLGSSAGCLSCPCLLRPFHGMVSGMAHIWTYKNDLLQNGQGRTIITKQLSLSLEHDCQLGDNLFHSPIWCPPTCCPGSLGPKLQSWPNFLPFIVMCFLCIVQVHSFHVIILFSRPLSKQINKQTTKNSFCSGQAW